MPKELFVSFMDEYIYIYKLRKAELQISNENYCLQRKKNISVSFENKLNFHYKFHTLKPERYVLKVSA